MTEGTGNWEDDVDGNKTNCDIITIMMMLKLLLRN